MPRPIAAVIAGLLLLAGCSGDDAPAGPPPGAKVVECGITAEMHGAAHPYALVRVTNAGDEPARFRVAVRFLNGGRLLGTGEALTPELAPGAATSLLATSDADVDAVRRCEVERAERV